MWASLWLYIWLVFLEGVLRKWILPDLAQGLLFIRDPLAIGLTLSAFGRGYFSRNYFLEFTFWFSMVCFFVSAFAGPTLGSTIYGYRSNFLHIPVAVLIPMIFDQKDWVRLKRVVLGLAFVNGVVMIPQYFASSNAFINAGAGSDAGQIGLGSGHIRPAGLFSFVTGPATFFPMVLGLLIGQTEHMEKIDRTYYVLALAGVALGAMFAGSRTLLVLAAFPILAYAIAASTYKPADLRKKIVVGALALPFLVPAVLATGAKDAVDTFVTSRIDNVQEGELSGRVFSLPSLAFEQVTKTPIQGFGLGVGTILGAKLAGKSNLYAYVDGEIEWVRNIGESGAILGGIFIAFRLLVSYYLLRIGFRRARRGDLVTVSLAGFAFAPIVVGNLGQTTQLGLTVVCCAMTVMSAKQPLPALARPAPVIDMSGIATEPAT